MRISRCLDCGLHVIRAGHWYMVHDEVWEQTGLDKHGGVLCLDCLEHRLGRAVSEEDFKSTTTAGHRDFWRDQGRMLPRVWSSRRSH